MKRILILTTLAFLFLQKGYGINPMKEYKLRPERFNIEYEEKKINTEDGAKLNTWIMDSPSGNKKGYTFIIAGSDAGNMGYTLAYAASLLKEGYDVITFDYRGFGESSDFEHRPSHLYHREYIKDFEAVVNWAKENTTSQIGILAFSMGTLIASAGYECAEYDLLVGEGFVKNPRENIKRTKKIKSKKLTLPKGAKSDGNKINKIDVPILLFASVNDEITTLEDSEWVVSQKPNRKIKTFDGEHLRGASTLGMGNYINEITKMIE